MEEKESKKEVKKEKIDRYNVGEIATQTSQVVVDTKTNKQYTEITFLAKLGNDIEELKKLLG